MSDKKKNEQKEMANIAHSNNSKSQENLFSQKSNRVTSNPDLTGANISSDGLRLSELLNFTSAILALISAAILYIVGWVYESYWYGFYGISLSQINISPQQTMVESAPSISIIFLVALVAVFSHKMYSNLNGQDQGSADLSSAPTLILLGATLAVLTVVVIVAFNWNYIQPLPIEIIISTVALVLIIGFLFFITTVANPKSTLRIIFAVGAVSISTSIRMSSLSEKMFQDLLVDALANNKAINKLLTDIENRGQVISTVLRNAWRLWVGFIVVFFLLLTITIAAVFGRANAHFIKRPMLGGWQANEVYINSGMKEKLPLNLSSTKLTSQGYEYGPFALIASDAQVYYLAEWKTGNYYEVRPNLYIFPRTNDTSLIILYLPQPTLTPLPSPTVTITSTVTPSALPTTSQTPVISTSKPSIP